jgi:hypothetical protein
MHFHCLIDLEASIKLFLENSVANFQVVNLALVGGSEDKIDYDVEKLRHELRIEHT